MRSLVTSGIKAILAIAVLTTAAHWAFRVQREPAAKTAMATIPDPVTTGSIEPRKVERAVPAAAPQVAAATTPGLDQQHLTQLMSGATIDRARPATVAAKPAPVKQAAPKTTAAKPVAKAATKPAPAKQADAKPIAAKPAGAKPESIKQLIATR